MRMMAVRPPKIHTNRKEQAKKVFDKMGGMFIGALEGFAVGIVAIPGKRIYNLMINKHHRHASKKRNLKADFFSGFLLLGDWIAPAAGAIKGSVKGLDGGIKGGLNAAKELLS